MSDRELLELAAKAAEIETKSDEHSLMTMASGPFQVAWNPLQNDGDALRLAMKLNITILPGGRVLLPDADGFCSPFGIAVGDEEVILAATRRAIVRAAAEIGRQMQESGAA